MTRGYIFNLSMLTGWRITHSWAYLEVYPSWSKSIVRAQETSGGAIHGQARQDSVAPGDCEDSFC